jgi:molecular chaperone DnaK (HSP70)
LIGRKFSDPELQENLKFLPYDVINSSDDRPIIQIPNEKGPVLLTTAEDITSIIVNRLKLNAEKNLGKEIPHAVVSYPVHFDDVQKEALRDAVKRGGFTRYNRLISEPMATGTAHRLGETGVCREDIEECHVLIYDVGERYSTVTIEEIDFGVTEIWEYLRERQHTGSHDLSSFESDFACSPSMNPPEEEDQCEKHRQYESPERIVRRVQQLLQNAKFTESGLDTIVVTGMNPQAYWVKSVLSNSYPRANNSDTSSIITPDTAIVYGTALLAEILSSDDGICTQSLPNVTMLPIGIETEHGQFTEIVPIGRQLPLHRRKFFEAYVSGDQQEDMGYITVRFYEGQRLIAKKNKLLGTVKMQTAIKGRVELEVRIDVDDDGLMEGRVREINGGKEARTDKLICNCNWEDFGDIQTDAAMHDYEDLEILQQRQREEVEGNGLRLFRFLDQSIG